ncbi:MAG: UDP-N-acetylmuramate:L-alanyl-gamma-D-glutamyl-meso-diaminopimelate ligase [Thiotrichales bacterium 32-46-8]|nr:MAG: UDP-N-acetylmuramate:L-alanyl-gamma-D-glutamyl-meso-diaminopimelate ligase [Thiotrichales bacterium 32-46-8]
MHIHILGICGTFMGGIAAIARQAGHRVTGCDANVYPPMSTQLESQGIELIEGFSPDQLLQFETMPDLFVIGNVVSRGNPLMEAILNQGLPYISGPQWLGEQVLYGKHVLAVAGTHGKTTTSAMLTWILEFNGYKPGYLIGGVPLNFTVSANLGEGKYFVIEADEYDTAFFDKRSKFVHYRPRTALLNNLEFDHADIYDNLAQIQKQFHHGMRLVPASGLVITPSQSDAIDALLAQGCWSSIAQHGSETTAEWSWRLCGADASHFAVLHQGQVVGEVRWSLLGEFNIRNALSAIIAAQHAGVPVAIACESLSQFKGVARRLTLLAHRNEIRVFEDFAHHPTAIQVTLAGLSQRFPDQRLIAVLEPRSNTMRMGAFKDQLATALAEADSVFMYQHPDWDWQIPLESFCQPVFIAHDYHTLLAQVLKQTQSGDVIVCMSNGGFGGVPKRLAEGV